MNRDIRSWVQDAYTDYRTRGLEAKVCLEQTAMDFGVRPRRVRQILEGDAISVTKDAWREMRRRFLLHLENEAAHALERAAKRTARLKQMERERTEFREGVGV